jgi:hypothetical protein
MPALPAGYRKPLKTLKIRECSTNPYREGDWGGSNLSSKIPAPFPA